MMDQANDLRKLVLQAAGPRAHAPSGPVKVALVVGGKGGVGTTTVAVNLAVAAAQQGRRTVLVDADPDRPDVQSLCRLRQRYTLSDVLHGRRTLAEALQPGPGGVMVLPGAWAAPDLADALPASQERLIAQLPALADRADLVVLDGGNGLHPVTRRLWQSCQELVLVASPDTNAVLDAYAALKVARDPDRHPRIHLLVNLCPRQDLAEEIHHRIRTSCQRFLGFDLPHCLWLPADARVVAAGRHGMPFALSQTRISAMKCLLALVRAIDAPEHQPPHAEDDGPRAPQIPPSTLALEMSQGDQRKPGLFRPAIDCQGSSAVRTPINPLTFSVPFNLDQENADSEEDRSFPVQC